jgi:hypothetical protein
VIDDNGTRYVYFLKLRPLTQSVFIQRPDARGNPQCCIKLKPSDLKATDAQAAADLQHIDITSSIGGADPGFAAYRIIPKLPIDSPFVGMAIMANEVTGRSPYNLLARTNGKQLSARVCFGIEGENLIVKEGRQREYSPLYLYFGYDIDTKPKCTSQDKLVLT